MLNHTLHCKKKIGQVWSLTFIILKEGASYMDTVAVIELLWALNDLHMFSTAAGTLKFRAQEVSKRYWNNDNKK